MSKCRPKIVCKVGCTAAMVAGMAAFSFTATPSGNVTIAETGSSLIYPLFKTWITAYAKVEPKVLITASATNSGTGIAQAIAKQVHTSAHRTPICPTTKPWQTRTY